MNTTETISKEEAIGIAGNALKAIFATQPMLKLYVKSKSFDADGTLNIRFTNKKGMNHAVIKLNALDLYDVTFHECRVLSKDPYIINNKGKTVSGLYWDMLGDTILKETGVEL